MTFGFPRLALGLSDAHTLNENKKEKSSTELFARGHDVPMVFCLGIRSWCLVIMSRDHEPIWPPTSD